MARLGSLAASLSSHVLSALVLGVIATAQASDVYIQGTNADGVTAALLDSRLPALYTGNFGDCMDGQSLINVTQFDAAYYADNMTVLFHLAGKSNLQNESVMIHISVEAYGEDRFDMTFNPCSANFASLCPLNASVPIFGEAIIPVSTSDVKSIIPIALLIPDFEGAAILRVFSNQTETQIACFQAVMNNGHSFSHPAAVGSVLGIFTVVALLSSFATAIYGVSVPEIRTHYAHSLSVLVVFEVFQSIFFSGALSLNWPSACTAFWSNFAWSAGMIHSRPMLSSINKLSGLSDSSSQVGDAGSLQFNNNGGLSAQIYGRSVSTVTNIHDVRNAQTLAAGEEMVKRLLKRVETSANETPTNGSKGYDWSGGPVADGLPLPGNWSGFAGDLSMVDIPPADAFLVGLLWFLILVVILVGAAIAFKWCLEGLSTIKWIKRDRFKIFRDHWLGFVSLIVLRAWLISFFMIMTLSLFQFSYGGKAGPIAIAVLVFLIFFAGILGLAVYACFFRAKFGRYQSTPDRIHIQRKKVLKFLPWFSIVRASNMEDADKVNSAGSVSWFRVDYTSDDAAKASVHEDVEYTTRFGWLSSRFRRTRWWFFVFWVVYQFIRACFVGGASASPKAQVIGLFVVEIIAFITIIWINPFEASRNTAMAVYLLGFSKVATAGLSIGFLNELNLARIPTTIIGIIIIVIQGFVVIALLILVALGAFSTYMSLTRNRDTFKPKGLLGVRAKYYEHISQRATDLPPVPPMEPEEEEEKEPYFAVKTVRRAPKIEDEDVVADMVTDIPEIGSANRSRSNTMRSVSNLPYGARPHRMSWSSRDFQLSDSEIGREGSPYAPGHNTANNSVSLQPLVRSKVSLTSLREDTSSTDTNPYGRHHASSGY